MPTAPAGAERAPETSDQDSMTGLPTLNMTCTTKELSTEPGRVIHSVIHSRIHRLPGLRNSGTKTLTARSRWPPERRRQLPMEEALNNRLQGAKCGRKSGQGAIYWLLMAYCGMFHVKQRARFHLVQNHQPRPSCGRPAGADLGCQKPGGYPQSYPQRYPPTADLFSTGNPATPLGPNVRWVDPPVPAKQLRDGIHSTLRLDPKRGAIPR